MVRKPKEVYTAVQATLDPLVLELRDRIIAQSAQINRLADALDTERTRYADLVRDVVNLKKEGYTTQPMVPVMEAPPPLPDEIQRAIEQISEPGSPDERRLRGIAAQYLGRNETAEAVAKRILEGEQVAWE